MSTKHVSPYRSGSKYDVIFNYISEAGTVTKSEVVLFAKSKGINDASVGVVMSPRKMSERGDCRGNRSSQGHVYFMESKSREVIDGIRHERKYVFHWRSKILKPHNRAGSVHGKIEAAKIIVKAKVKVTKEKVHEREREEEAR